VNQGTWARLEDLGREWAKHFNGVHIVSGTIFDDDDDHQPDDPSEGFVTKDGSDVSVPSHYFKVFLRMEGGELVSIAFIIPNTTSVPGRNAQDTTKDRFLKRSLRTVGDILERKGVDLFPEMSPEMKATLKAFRATELWSSN
jgi:DNA/RNA endonuclease G (NUC1)